MREMSMSTVTKKVPNPHVMEASEMLAEALKQMDGLLSGDYGSPRSSPYPHQNGVVVNEVPSPKPATRKQHARTVKLLEELRLSLETAEERDTIFQELPVDTQTFLHQWLAPTNGHLVNAHNGELLSRGQQDTHKLDLMAENSNLKLRLATLDREKLDTEEKYQFATKRIDELQGRLNERTIELTDLRTKAARSGSTLEHSDSFRGGALEKEKTIERLRRKHGEVDKLKKAVECLVTTNDEKDQHINELRRLLKRYKKIEEMVLTAQGRKGLEQLGIRDDDSDTSSTHNSQGSSVDNTIKEAQPYDRLEINETQDVRNMPFPSATSTPVNHLNGSPKFTLSNGNGALHTPPSTIMKNSPVLKKAPPLARSNSCEDMKPPSKTPPGVRRRGEGFAQTDEDAMKDEMAQQYKAMTITGNEAQKKKNKGFKRFFGRLRRSSSQDLNADVPEGQLEDFKRGGVRATAGPRLGWSKDVKYHDVDMPFARWDCDRIMAWLHSIGLSMYVGECKRMGVKNGAQLLKMNHHEVEKEMNIKNYFHKKKLQLALQSMASDTRSPMDNLDYNWVTRWLDDIGLPQYKEFFQDARVDGRMLHYMSIDDLVSLKVSNSLHHLSIKRGIQVLRNNNFNPICLKRRPAPDEGQLQDCPDEVALWTNHRVMEWLRGMDLSEYAPNLRGSGVHGGLMVLEPRFGAELFATILSIPSTRTLLRRHLSTHFVALIGNATQMKKRELESKPGNVPLTPNQKIKLKKFGIFKGHRRTQSHPHDEDLICPMDLQDSEDSQQNGGMSLKRDSSLGRSDKEHGKTGKEIGVLSSEISSLTHMLARDHQFLDDVPTSDV